MNARILYAIIGFGTIILAFFAPLIYINLCAYEPKYVKMKLILWGTNMYSVNVKIPTDDIEVFITADSIRHISVNGMSVNHSIIDKDGYNYYAEISLGKGFTHTRKIIAHDAEHVTGVLIKKSGRDDIIYKWVDKKKESDDV